MGKRYPPRRLLETVIEPSPQAKRAISAIAREGGIKKLGEVAIQTRVEKEIEDCLKKGQPVDERLAELMWLRVEAARSLVVMPRTHVRRKIEKLTRQIETRKRALRNPAKKQNNRGFA